MGTELAQRAPVLHDTQLLQDRISRLESLLEQFAREYEDARRRDAKCAAHMAETCDDIRLIIERLRAEATRQDAAEQH